MDCKRTGIRNGVVDINELYAHNSGRNSFAGFDYGKLGVAQKSLFGKLHLNKSHAETGGVNRNVQLLKKIRNGAYVVLVPVGDEKPLDFILVFFKIGEIGNYKINAEHFIIRERHSAVNNDDFVFILINCHIFSDFAKSAERYYFKRRIFCRQRRSSAAALAAESIFLFGVKMLLRRGILPAAFF